MPERIATSTTGTSSTATRQPEAHPSSPRRSASVRNIADAAFVVVRGGVASGGYVALVNRLVLTECATGTAVRVCENTALRSLLAEAAPKYPQLISTPDAGDGDYSLRTLDARTPSPGAC